MFEAPKDVDGKCDACLLIADDYGDNDCTFRCILPQHHAGPHEENFEREGKSVIVSWVDIERKEQDEGEN